jgi:type II secretion system (T2SS) protein M
MMGRVLREKRHLILPLAIVLLANVAIFVLVLVPLSRKVAGGEAQAHAAAAQLDAARNDYTAARLTVTGKQTADKALQQFYSSVLPPDLSGARRVMYNKINPLLRASNLQREDSAIGATQQKDSPLGKLTMVVDFSGSYSDIRRFIHAVETSPEFLVIENVQVAQQTGVNATGLKVTIHVSTYYRSAGDAN